MSMSELCRMEHTSLRDELHNLKECQVRYIFYSVIATGVLLGVAGNDKLASSMPWFAALLPLAVVLPFWWIFFDKAMTIARAVGYYRMLEDVILGRAREIDLIGWENALGRFRCMQEAGLLSLPSHERKADRRSQPSCQQGVKRQSRRLRERAKELATRVLRLALLRTSHRYWLLTYYVFLGLSLLSLLVGMILSWSQITEGEWQVPLIAAGCFVLISAWWNGRVVWRLLYGRHSYDANEYLWRQVLRSRGGSCPGGHLSEAEHAGARSTGGGAD